MKKRKSIHDLAKELQISATTISFILNGKGKEKRISKDLEQRVLQYVKETGYQPNLIAQSLRTGKSKIIGMMVEDISDPFFSGIARIIEMEAYKLGYKIFFSSTENVVEKAKALIQIFRDRQVDGYIIAPTPGIEEEIRELQNDHFPVVLFDRYFPSLETNNIIVDNFDGAHNAIDYFVENGFKNIGLVTLKSGQTQMIDRLEGYKKAIEEHGLKPCIETIEYHLDETAISKTVIDFLNENKHLEAILFATNYLAIAGLRALREMDLTVPNDIAIIGFDDNTHFNLFNPSITAVAQPVTEISNAVVARIMECLTDPKANREKKTIVLKTQLVIRSSCKKGLN